ISGHRREDDYRHLVHVAQGSLLSKIINRDSFETNTKHNEAVVEAAGGDFLVSARADDCVVEAVEPKKPWSDFVLGVQWHPEELASSAKNEQEIFNAFVKAAGRG
ncbi:MAG: gamma-glutamyl-gamma-aminobutyrate hydrolase family protein, partial [Rickettsiales bacterium]|nr:gamma-glutamyl-gamma-aminobutyrate hydrolase family protein [Rickettsiales bacterium]